MKIQINKQPPEKQSNGDGATLQVNSIFYTIQGEGIFAGSPAVFVRLAGCNLQCPACDTEYTKRSEMSIYEISSKILQLLIESTNSNLTMRRLVVITGGEPFRQNLVPFTNLLLSMGYLIQIETNGTLYQEIDKNIFVVCSPKTSSINQKLLPHISAFKYVVDYNNIDSDGLPITALDHPSNGAVYKAPLGKLIFIQPADEKDNESNKLNIEAAKKSVMLHNRILCIQLHKLIGVE